MNNVKELTQMDRIKIAGRENICHGVQAWLKEHGIETYFGEQPAADIFDTLFEDLVFDILRAQWIDGGITNGNGRYVVETENSQCVVQMSAGGSMDRVGGMNIIRYFHIPT